MARRLCPDSPRWICGMSEPPQTPGSTGQFFGDKLLTSDQPIVVIGQTRHLSRSTHANRIDTPTMQIRYPVTF